MAEQAPLPEHVREALARVARGDAGLHVLATALRATSGMIAVIAEGETATYLRSLAQHARWTESSVPTPAGLPGPDGRPVPRGFTSNEAAGSWARAKGFAREDTVLLVQGTPWADALRGCVNREDAGLVIDDGTSHAITLGRGDLQRLLGFFEPPPRSSLARTLLDRAREGVTPPPVLAPRRTDEASRAFLEALEAKLGQGLPTWLFVESLMYEMTVHLQIDPNVQEGLRWPSSHRGLGELGRGTVFAFAGADTLGEAIARRPDAGTTAIELAAVEALRWIVAAPSALEILTVVGRLHEKGQARPADIYLPALLPTAHHIPDLRRVPEVALGRIGALPGGRALRPEAVRALALGWRQLAGFADGRTVRLDGRAWKPVASSPHGAPDPAGNEPPFLRWLGQLDGAAGLVLDPDGPAPLKIEPVDLLMLDRWAAHPERQPDAHEALLWAAGLLAAGTITPEMAGRIAADFPFYWICARSAGAQVEVLMYPNTDALLLFTSESWARHFLGGGRLAEGFTPGRVRFDWARNPFVMALEDYSEAWIDPGSPTSGGGLRLSYDALGAAVARLDETLKPRVPGFIAE